MRLSCVNYVYAMQHDLLPWVFYFLDPVGCSTESSSLEPFVLFEPLDLLDLFPTSLCIHLAGVPHVPGRCEKVRRIRRTRARAGKTRSPVSVAIAATSTTAADGPRQPSLRTARTARQPTHQPTNQPLPKPNRAEQINRHRLEHLDHPAGWVPLLLRVCINLLIKYVVFVRVVCFLGELFMSQSFKYFLTVFSFCFF